MEDGKIPKNAETFTVEYPDDPYVLYVLHTVAKKAENTGRAFTSLTVLHRYNNDFVYWNYRILADDFHSAPYSDGPSYIADRLHTEAERNFAFVFDNTLRNKGYFQYKCCGGSGPYIDYFNSKSLMLHKGPYVLRLVSSYSKLYLFLRIRNAEKCLEKINEFSDSVKAMFRYSEPGCINKQRGTCNHSVSYIFEGEEKWHCGCYKASFSIQPVVDEIPQYLKLIELGLK
jgi:hypothetical protein